MTRSEALKLRSAMELSALSLDDKTASTAPTMFPRLKGDYSLVPAGTRINWNGVVKKATTDLCEGDRDLGELCGSHQGCQVPFGPPIPNAGLLLRRCPLYRMYYNYHAKLFHTVSKFLCNLVKILKL